MSLTAHATARPAPPPHRIRWLSGIPYFSVHILAVAGIVTYGWSWWGLAIAMAGYYGRMWFVTAGYHRYFSHRTFRTSRVFQFILALGAQTTTQKGVLWWAGNHRRHHKFSDQPGDPHSVRLNGFYWSHTGWIIADTWEKTDLEQVPDLARYPELRVLNHLPTMPAVAYAVACYFLGGVHGLLWGYFVSTTLLWHGTFTINSLSHVFGKRRYATDDDSKNNWLLALITMGEGWHNNHHHYQAAARNGFFWWEIDVTYYVLRALALVGVVSDLREPPARVLAEGRVRARMDGECDFAPPPPSSSGEPSSP